jgi:biopolymer transport protein ExbB/TolQ
MSIKKKIAEVKKKIEENPFLVPAIAFAVPTVTYVVASIYQRKLLVESTERWKKANNSVQDINSAIREMKETGKPITFNDQNDHPLFDIAPPTENED